VLLLLAFYDAKLAQVVVDGLPLSVPDGAGLKVEIVVDHFILSAVGFVHAVQDVFVGLVAYEGEGVDFVAGDALEVVELVVDVFGQVLAARVEDVGLVLEDVGEGRAGGVVPQLPFTSSIHRI
jgi:hypothetical protein